MTLTYKDFSHQNLNGQNLSNQNLSACRLIHTQINGGNLSNSILDGAILEYAQLSGANLTNTSLRGANLHNANLEYAQLDGADFSGANVRGTKFKGTTELSEQTKKILKENGAIIDDIPNAFEHKWWIEKVLIPIATLLIGSSGIVGLWQLSQPQSAKSNPSSPSIGNTQPNLKTNPPK